MSQVNIIACFPYFKQKYRWYRAERLRSWWHGFI